MGNFHETPEGLLDVEEAEVSRDQRLRRGLARAGGGTRSTEGRQEHG